MEEEESGGGAQGVSPASPGNGVVGQPLGGEIGKASGQPLGHSSTVASDLISLSPTEMSTLGLQSPIPSYQTSCTRQTATSSGLQNPMTGNQASSGLQNPMTGNQASSGLQHPMTRIQATDVMSAASGFQSPMTSYQTSTSNMGMPIVMFTAPTI